MSDQMNMIVHHLLRMLTWAGREGGMERGRKRGRGREKGEGKGGKDGERHNEGKGKEVERKFNTWQITAQN